MLVLLLLGFSAGLALALTGATLQAWLTVEGVNLETIGLFTLVAQPYIYKFVWAPLMDRYSIPFLGRRRGWLILTQILLLATIAWMASISPQDSLWLLSGLALAVAFLSASQDIVFDAYRADILQEAQERETGSAVSVFGYRIAMLVSGALALFLAENLLGWHGTYLLMAVLMAIGIVTTWNALEPVSPRAPPRTLGDAVRQPFVEFFARDGAWMFLLLIVLYKLGDAFAASLTTTFLLRGLGFSLTDIALANKVFGIAAAGAGALLGGAMMVRLGLYRALLVFGIFQAVSNFAYVALALAGKNYAVMISAIAIENICGGMGTTAFVALLIALCDPRFSATQFALLSALAAVGRVYVGPASAYLVGAYGWANFFSITFLLALPGLAMLWWQRARIEVLDRTARAA